MTDAEVFVPTELPKAPPVVYVNDPRFLPEVALRTGLDIYKLRELYFEAAAKGEEFYFVTDTYDDRPLEEIRAERRYNPEIVDLAMPYYDSMTEEQALLIAKETIEEWDYQTDKHGYCHERSVLVALVKALDERNLG